MRAHVNLSILTMTAFALTGTVYASTDKTDNKVHAVKSDAESNTINKDVIAGNWKQFKGIIQQKWAKLTNDDVLKMKGTATELEGILQEKYGYTKEEVKKTIQEFLDENKAHLTQE